MMSNDLVKFYDKIELISDIYGQYFYYSGEFTITGVSNVSILDKLIRDEIKKIYESKNIKCVLYSESRKLINVNCRNHDKLIYKVKYKFVFKDKTMRITDY